MTKQGVSAILQTLGNDTCHIILRGGRQDHQPGHPTQYGQSITDSCISFEETERLIEQFATAQQMRARITS